MHKSMTVHIKCSQRNPDTGVHPWVQKPEYGSSIWKNWSIPPSLLYWASYCFCSWSLCSQKTIQNDSYGSLPVNIQPGSTLLPWLLAAVRWKSAVTVDRDYISSITFHQLDETVAAMYPLMEPALHDLSLRSVKSSLRRMSLIPETASIPPWCSWAPSALLWKKPKNKRSHSRKSYLREWPSLPSQTSTAPAIIKKSDRLNTSSFNRFHGEWKRI